MEVLDLSGQGLTSLDKLDLSGFDFSKIDQLDISKYNEALEKYQNL